MCLEAWLGLNLHVGEQIKISCLRNEVGKPNPRDLRLVNRRLRRQWGSPAVIYRLYRPSANVDQSFSEPGQLFRRHWAALPVIGAMSEKMLARADMVSPGASLVVSVISPNISTRLVSAKINACTKASTLTKLTGPTRSVAGTIAATRQTACRMRAGVAN